MRVRHHLVIVPTVFLLLLIGLIVYSHVTGPTPTSATTTSASKFTNLSDLTVIQIGSTNPILDKVLNELENSGATIYRFEDFPAEITVEGRILIAFDGDWVSQQLEAETANETTAMALREPAEGFFNAVVFREETTAFIAIGGRTSTLLKVLYVAGIYQDYEDLTPLGQPEPLVVGYRWRPRPSVLIVEAASTEGVLEALAGWMGA